MKTIIAAAAALAAVAGTAVAQEPPVGPNGVDQTYTHGYSTGQIPSQARNITVDETTDPVVTSSTPADRDVVNTPRFRWNDN